MPHLSESAERQTQPHGQNDTRPAQAPEHPDGYAAGGGEGCTMNFATSQTTQKVCSPHSLTTICHSERSEESAQANDGNTHFAPGQIPHSVRNDRHREGTERPCVPVRQREA